MHLIELILRLILFKLILCILSRMCKEIAQRSIIVITKTIQTNIDKKQLFEQQPLGYSLEQAFYNDEDIFRIDLQSVLSKQWHFVDHESNLPKAGDYITQQFGNESIIIVRDKENQLHAHFNVCRHRGSRICAKEKGNSPKLVCPYHAWVYEYDGSLKSARQMPEDFKPEDHSLHSCRIEVLEGLIFINLNAEDASDFSEIAENVRSFIEPHGIPKAKVAYSETYTVAANWKLVAENFRECYHCSASHPEYTTVNAYVLIGDKKLDAYKPIVDEWKETYPDPSKEAGYKDFPYALQPHHAWRMPIKEGFKTATQDGTEAAPLMGDFKTYDGAETVVFFGALSYFFLNNDYTSTFRLTPKSASETDVTVTWLVDGSAEEKVDYDIEKIKWMWDVTTLQDKKIVEENQIGVNSSRYVPGPYSLREHGTASFISWYLARLQGKPEERKIFS